MASDDQLAEIRADIDSIDKQLLELINARAECARRVAQIKLAASQDGDALFYRPEREAQILRAIQERNPGPLPADQAARIFRGIMSTCLALAPPLAVGFLGPVGTYSQVAALKHFGQSAILEPQPTIRDVFRLAEDRGCDMAVVPVENSTEGMVGQTLDCFLESPLQIIGEVELPVIHHLIAGASQDLSDISVVCGHEQALGQCRDWLDAKLPGVPRDVCRINGEAAQRAQSEPGVAAIAGDLAVETYQLTKQAEAIQDIAHNTTRFFVIGRETVPSSGADKTSILIASRNRL